MTGELTLSIRPEAASIRSAQQAVAAHFRAAGLGAGAVGRAEVVVEEVALNAFRHGGAGEVTLEAVYCLGLCATAPAAMIDDRLVGRLTEQRLDAVLAETLK